MKKQTKPKLPSAGSRIIASLQEAVDWVEGQDVAVRVTTVEVPVIDVKTMRRRLGLSQADFAAKFGFRRRHCGIGSKGGRIRTVRRVCCWQ